MSGKLTGVGVGPGDPALLTFKAAHLVQSAAILSYVVDSKGSSYARQTVSGLIHPGQVELPLFFSMSPDISLRRKSRREAAEKILQYLNAGTDVVFIVEGDPLLYSTFQHLLSEIPQEVPVEVCPGISAMFSASAAACFPLAIEDQMVIVAPAETALSDIREWLCKGYGVVLFKVTHWLEAIAAEINKLPFQCDTVLIERASLDGEVIVQDIAQWNDRDVPYFSIVLLRRRIHRSEDK